MASREATGLLTERLNAGLVSWVLAKARSMFHESKHAETFFPETAVDGQAPGPQDSVPWIVHCGRRRHCIQELRSSAGATEAVDGFRAWMG